MPLNIKTCNICNLPFNTTVFSSNVCQNCDIVYLQVLRHKTLDGLLDIPYLPAIGDFVRVRLSSIMLYDIVNPVTSVKMQKAVIDLVDENGTDYTPAKWTILEGLDVHNPKKSL